MCCNTGYARETFLEKLVFKENIWPETNEQVFSKAINLIIDFYENSRKTIH